MEILEDKIKGDIKYNRETKLMVVIVTFLIAILLGITTIVLVRSNAQWESGVCLILSSDALETQQCNGDSCERIYYITVNATFYDPHNLWKNNVTGIITDIIKNEDNIPHSEFMAIDVKNKLQTIHPGSIINCLCRRKDSVLQWESSFSIFYVWTMVLILFVIFTCGILFELKL